MCPRGGGRWCQWAARLTAWTAPSSRTPWRPATPSCGGCRPGVGTTPAASPTCAFPSRLPCARFALPVLRGLCPAHGHEFLSTRHEKGRIARRAAPLRAALSWTFRRLCCVRACRARMLGCRTTRWPSPSSFSGRAPSSRRIWPTSGSRWSSWRCTATCCAAGSCARTKRPLTPAPVASCEGRGQVVGVLVGVCKMFVGPKMFVVLRILDHFQSSSLFSPLQCEVIRLHNVMDAARAQRSARCTPLSACAARALHAGARGFTPRRITRRPSDRDSKQ